MYLQKGLQNNSPAWDDFIHVTTLCSYVDSNFKACMNQVRKYLNPIKLKCPKFWFGLSPVKRSSF